jgi:glucosylceramidase
VRGTYSSGSDHTWQRLPLVWSGNDDGRAVDATVTADPSKTKQGYTGVGFSQLPAGFTEDPTLKYFSIQRDIDAHIVDTVKLIQRYNPRATFFASAWSASAWMKSRGAAKVSPKAAMS